jgi:hypothetical protein
MESLDTKCPQGTGRPQVTRSGAERRLSRPGRRVRTAAAGAKREAKAPRHAPRLRPFAIREGRRNPRASGRPLALRSPGLGVANDASNRTRRTDTAARPPRAQRLKRFAGVSEQSVPSRSRRVVDGNRTRDNQVMRLVLYPLSYHDLILPRFRIPIRNTPGQDFYKKCPERRGPDRTSRTGKTPIRPGVFARIASSCGLPGQAAVMLSVRALRARTCRHHNGKAALAHQRRRRGKGPRFSAPAPSAPQGVSTYHAQTTCIDGAKFDSAPRLRRAAPRLRRDDVPICRSHHVW